MANVSDASVVGDAAVVDAASYLYPALFKVFGVILVGYVAGRAKIVNHSDSKGIGIFVTKFSLPALIFLALAKMDFSTVNVSFLLSILVGKAIVFFGTMVVTLLVTRPTNLGRAGIFAIFCTHSNDFALGWPIIHALYLNTNPLYASYLYLMAPINLVMLNPFAFALMEMHRQKEGAAGQAVASSKLKLVQRILKGLALNPIIAATVLGLISNFTIKSIIMSAYIKDFLNTFGVAFASTALFMLGHHMVGQVHKLKGRALVLPAILIMTKLIILPIVLRTCVKLIGIEAGDTAATALSLSTYSILYGTTATAAAVFMFSHMYNCEIDLIASSMVLCTLTSGPIMFVTAKMILVTSDFRSDLITFCFDLSIVSLLAALCVLVVFILKKKYKLMPQRLTLCLVVTQLLLAASVLGGGPAADGTNTIQQVIKTYSQYSCFLWTSMLCVGIFLMEIYSVDLLVKIWPVLAVVAWGVPAALVGIWFGVNGASGFVFKGAVTLRLIVLVICLIVTFICLILYVRYRWRSGQFVSLAAVLTTTSSGHEDTPAPAPAAPAGESGTEHQMLKHTLYIVEATLSMFIGIIYTTWTTATDDETGIFGEIAFLDVFVGYGQAIVLFLFFGFDFDKMVMPICNFCRKKWWRVRTYKSVFRGSCLVRWLLSCGLAKDEQEAVQYGRLIAHINHKHHFTNSSLLYLLLKLCHQCDVLCI